MGLLDLSQSPVWGFLSNRTQKERWEKLESRLDEALSINKDLSNQVELLEDKLHERRNGIRLPYGYANKDISAAGLAKMRALAHTAWVNHPLAKKGMRTKRSFVCQEGFQVVSCAEDETTREIVQEYLDEMWAINWEGMLEKRVESLGVYGELIRWPSKPNGRGLFEFGAIPREAIQEILPNRYNCEKPGLMNLSTPIVIVETGPDGKEKEVQRNCFEVASYSALKKCFSGEVFYLGVNTLDTTLRGISDLAPILDHLDVFDQLVWTEAERVKMLRSLLFHYKMKGATPEMISAKSKELAKRPVKPGGWLASNESVEIEMFSPNLGTQSNLEFIEYVFGISSGLMDLPKHFYYTAGDVNRASAKEMTQPIYAGIRDRKREVATLIHDEHAYALKVASKVETSKVFGLTSEELKIEVRSRDPERDALSVIGQHLLEFGKALQLAQLEGWMDQQQVGEKFREAASGIGLGEIADPNEEPDIEIEQAKAREKLEHVRPQFAENFPLALDGDPDWKISREVA